MKNLKLYFSLLIISALVYSACQGKKADSTSDTAAVTPAPEATAPAAAPVNAEGKKTFETYCILCHGADGKLGLNGSKDLSISTLSIEEKINQVTNGKNTMTPFKDILTADEIKAVAEYTLSLKQ
jgi:cytochrome c6